MNRLTILSLVAVIATLVACSNRYRPKVEVPPGPGDRELIATGGLAAACPATADLKAISYGDVASGDIPREIAARSCVADVASHLDAEIACARKFNAESLERALTERGLTRTEHRVTFDYHVGYPTGDQIGKIIELDDDAREDLKADRVLYLGENTDGYRHCSRSTNHSAPASARFLARDREGRLVIVQPTPAVERRRYDNCSCFAGCGIESPPPPPLIVALGPDEVVSETVTLAFPALLVTTQDVESQTCCCAA